MACLIESISLSGVGASEIRGDMIEKDSELRGDMIGKVLAPSLLNLQTGNELINLSF